MEFKDFKMVFLSVVLASLFYPPLIPFYFIGLFAFLLASKKIPTQKIFKIPYSYIQKNILSKATKDDKGRYLFEVNKNDLRFNWRHRIPMEGAQFLLSDEFKGN